jgi:DNA-binding CsgD family transcriptional regulator
MARTSGYSALLDSIYGAVADPHLWPSVLATLSDHLNAIGGMLVYNAAPGRGRSFQVNGRLAEELTPTYLAHYTWNPWNCGMTRVPVGKVVIANSLVESGVIPRTAFYADVLAPQGIVDMFCINHRDFACEGSVGGIGFCLSARGADMADQNAQYLQRLTPHLFRALDATLRLGHLADGTPQLARVMQLMPNPALLLDGKSRIIHTNQSADALLRTGDGVTVTRNGGLHLSASFPGETAALSRALAQALAVASGSGDELCEPLRLTRPSGAAPLLVLPVPLPPPAFAMWELLGGARVMVLVIDPNAKSQAAASTMQATFGLTAAESRVAALIGSGVSGPQAAAALGISLATVKTHLKRCFEKTGVHSQVSLARIIGNLQAYCAVGGD